MFLIYSYTDLQVTEQLWVQPEGLITQEVLQAASHKAWDKALCNLHTTSRKYTADDYAF